MSLLNKFSIRKTQKNQIKSVVNNLNHILNTKKGFGSYLKRFGIGDYNLYKARHKIIETILEEIKENIETYEPRVELIDIEEVESDVAHRLRFEMKCVILRKDKPIYVIFDSVTTDVMVEGIDSEV